jgi:hypothetical protein
MISSQAGRAGIVRQLNKICQPGQEPLASAALALWLPAWTSFSGASALLVDFIFLVALEWMQVFGQTAGSLALRSDP